MNEYNPKNAVFTSYNSIFLNSDNLFVEYDDVIKSPFFLLLYYIKENEDMNKVFDFSEIINMDMDELYEWYLERPYKNIMMNFDLKDESAFKSEEEFATWISTFVYTELDKLPDLIKQDTSLNFSKALSKILTTDLVKNIYIWSEVYSQSLEEEIRYNFPKAKYVYGLLTDVIQQENMTNDSTFIFSNISNISALEELNLLTMSSIMLADKYGYNYDNIISEWMSELNNKYEFKIDFFDNINSYDE